MIRLLLALAMLLAPFTATAATRTFGVGSFDRVRVEGPFVVRVTTGTAPRASASADQALLDRLLIEVNGTTLVVRLSGLAWRDLPDRGSSTPPLVTLATPMLQSVYSNAGAQVSVAGMKAQTLALSVTGTGSITVTGADTDILNATLIGPGAMTLAGRGNRTRLTTNGSGLIDATKLTVNDLIVRLDGPGETRAAARYTATVSSTGLGKVTVTGNAKCQVARVTDGPVTCGVGAGTE